MIKIALITYYGDNYGGCLQAYALQQTLNNGGFESKIINVNVSINAKNTLKNTLLKYFNILIHPFAFFKRRPYIKNHSLNELSYRHQAFQEFRKKYLQFDETIVINNNNMECIRIPYDICVCGSDQIWNPILYGVNPIWTLKMFDGSIKKVAYAPSLGISEIPEKFSNSFKTSLADFSYLSVREKDGADSLSKVLDRNVDVVLDPTLLLTSEQWQKMMVPVNGITGKYIFCYLFGNYKYIQEVKSKVKELTGLHVISLPYNLRELNSDDQLLYDVSPCQFVWLIANATYVLTDSFHASVFSIKMNTPFITLKRSSNKDKKNMNSRIYTLLQLVNLENRLLSEDEIDRTQSILSKSIDFEKCNELLAKAMSRDKNKLYDAIRK